MNDFIGLVGNTVDVKAEVEKIVKSGHSNDYMILLKDVYVNDVFFRNHSWVKMTKRFEVVVVGDKFTATALLVWYIDANTNKKDKLGFRSFRNIKIHNRKL